MSPTPSTPGVRPSDPQRDKHAGGDPGGEIPRRPADSTASGEATNDTGEDNQRQKGETPADEFIRR